MKAISTGATARARDPCTDNFRSPASKHQTVISKLWQVLRPGQLKLLPIAHVYPCAWALMRSAGSSNGVGNNGLTESVPLLGTYAFRDRHVTSPSCLLRAALMYVISICNFTCIWRLPDVYWMASSFGSTAVSHIALHAMRIHAYMES